MPPDTSQVMSRASRVPCSRLPSVAGLATSALILDVGGLRPLGDIMPSLCDVRPDSLVEEDRRRSCPHDERVVFVMVAEWC